NESWHAEGVDRASDPGKAVLMAGQEPVFVVGGAEIYRQLLPCCKEIWLTRVWSGVLGDTKLSIDLSNFRVLEQTRVPASDRDDVPTEFIRLVRQNS
ncbi:MAG: dihydrofolate reductase, partial [Rubripirellula sp.]